VWECLPAHIPKPDFSKLDRELEKLERQEDEVEASLDADEKLVEDALERIRVSRSKAKQLRKQKRLLKCREKEIFETGRAEAEELEGLEELEFFNCQVASVNPEAPAGAAVVDWSPF
ncbi:hypothetical protein CC86DRAFT_309549, partial [Ophiobolus disseminans]